MAVILSTATLQCYTPLSDWVLIVGVVLGKGSIHSVPCALTMEFNVRFPQCLAVCWRGLIWKGFLR